MIGLFDLIRLFPTSRKIFLSVVFIGMLTLFFFFYGDRDYKKDITISRKNSYIEGLRIVSKKNGADAWVMTALKADFTKDETIARMDTVTIDIKKDGVILNADKGIYNMNTRDLHLENNITIWVKGSVISTQDLSWNASSGILSSNNKIRMEGNKFRVEGEGLTATEDNKVTLKRNVKAIFF